jgi:hypothetical protein
MMSFLAQLVQRICEKMQMNNISKSGGHVNKKKNFLGGGGGGRYCIVKKGQEFSGMSPTKLSLAGNN